MKKIVKTQATPLLIAVAIFLFGCSSDKGDLFISSQKEVLDKLKTYHDSGNRALRIRIQNDSTDSAPLMRSIFGAIEIVASGKVPYDDVQIINASWDIICNNSAASVYCIDGLIEENYRGLNEGNYLAEGGKDCVDLGGCFFILRRIAQIEIGTNGLHALQRHANGTRREIAKHALSEYNIVNGENWRIASLKYKRDSSGASLQWIANNMLQKGVKRMWVKQLLGEGVENADFTVSFRGIMEGNSINLRVSFFDDRLTEWKIK